MSDLELRRERVAAMTAAGMTAAVIAEALHVTPRTVIRDRRALGISKPRPEIVPAEKWHAAEALIDDGASICEAARTVGIGQVTANRHFPGRGWTRRQITDYMVLRRQEKRMLA
jgi:transposase